MLRGHTAFFLILVLVAGMVISPILLDEAEAAKKKKSTKKTADDISTISFRGLGKVTCADGTVTKDVQLKFDAGYYDGSLYGNYYYSHSEEVEIEDEYGYSYNVFDKYQSGTVVKGKISKNSVDLKGIADEEGYSEYQSVFCEGSPYPTVFALKGKCGVNVKVTLTAENGDKGVFKGNAACL